MKKTISLLTAFALAFLVFPRAYAGEKEINVSARSAALLCANNGKALYLKNAREKLPMASTTKIMTALIAIEAAEPDMKITATDEMVSVEGTSMGLKVGDKASMRDLVYGMLLQSGNDAANAVAYALGGSPEGFARLMNARAARIGMKDTRFATASGLDGADHYSTAYDMALLAKESLSNPEFASICSKKSVRITYGNPPSPHVLTNHNRLLWSYRYAVGIKTGFTRKSGRCLVSAAKKDGITLVAATLDAPDDWNDHIVMLEYGFSKYRGTTLKCDLSDVFFAVAGGETDSAPLRLSYEPKWIQGEEYGVKILLRPFEYAPVAEGDAVGKAAFFSGGTVVDEVPLLAAKDVGRAFAPDGVRKSPRSRLWKKIEDFFKFRR